MDDADFSAMDDDITVAFLAETLNEIAAEHPDAVVRIAHGRYRPLRFVLARVARPDGRPAATDPDAGICWLVEGDSAPAPESVYAPKYLFDGLQSD